MDVIECSALNNRESLIHLMGHYFASVGANDIKMEIEGFAKPSEYAGTERAHVPDLTATLANNKQVMVTVELTDGTTNSLQMLISRLQLFHSVTRAEGGEFHVVVPRWMGKQNTGEALSLLLDRIKIKPDRLWILEST